MTLRTRCIVLSMAAVFCLSAPAYGQAYCALRDPVSTIAQMIPEGESYRSHVRVVRKQHQETLREVVDFTIMNGELGQHTLYVVYKDEERIGFVHTRTEKGRFGLNEITWALDDELRVLSFQLQRCRDPAQHQVDSKALDDLLSGRSASQLAEMLDSQGQLRADVMAFESDTSREYASSLVRSAVKTILISRLVWTDLF